ncbi:MAG: 4-hydroxybenzoate octaprenyltransferase [Deltaproteobacteria bacterium]|nr:4-hydroxybenzoate octaprenyltransferase [Deltaproteobacteria bacterium]
MAYKGSDNRGLQPRAYRISEGPEVLGKTLSRARLEAVLDLIRFRKQYGTALLLCPALWSLFMASKGSPSIKYLVIFITGAFLMRSAGCVINDIADRRFDRLVERTRTRPLADGRLTVKEAALVFVLFSLMAFSLVFFLNPLTIFLSFAGIILASIYPLVKRASHLPQVWLGMAFGWGAIMAWSAVTGSVETPAVLLFIANIFWSTAYDTIYALMDIEDDLKVGVKSTAILFGRHVYTALVFLYIAMAVLLFAAGIASGMGVIYHIGIAVSLMLFMLIVLSVKKYPSRHSAFRGFLLNVWVGGIILFLIIVG